MDLVDEQHVALFEIGEQRREIAGLRDHRARRGAKPDAELLGHDLRQRRLAEAGRPRKQHVVERVAARLRRLDEHAQICARLLLANELGERARPDRRLEGVRFVLRRADEAFGHPKVRRVSNSFRTFITI